jgi:hypothetical protein
MQSRHVHEYQPAQKGSSFMGLQLKSGRMSAPRVPPVPPAWRRPANELLLNVR